MNADEEIECGSEAQGPVATPVPSPTPEEAATATAAAAAATAATGDGVKPAAKRRTGLAPSTSFNACRPALSQETIEVVQEMGFESMTPVQVCIVLRSAGASDSIPRGKGGNYGN